MIRFTVKVDGDGCIRARAAGGGVAHGFVLARAAKHTNKMGYANLLLFPNGMGISSNDAAHEYAVVIAASQMLKAMRAPYNIHLDAHGPLASHSWLLVPAASNAPSTSLACGGNIEVDIGRDAFAALCGISGHGMRLWWEESADGAIRVCGSTDGSGLKSSTLLRCGADDSMQILATPSLDSYRMVKELLRQFGNPFDLVMSYSRDWVVRYEGRWVAYKPGAPSALVPPAAGRRERIVSSMPCLARVHVVSPGHAVLLPVPIPVKADADKDADVEAGAGAGRGPRARGVRAGKSRSSERKRVGAGGQWVAVSPGRSVLLPVPIPVGTGLLRRSDPVPIPAAR